MKIHSILADFSISGFLWILGIVEVFPKPFAAFSASLWVIHHHDCLYPMYEIPRRLLFEKERSFLKKERPKKVHTFAWMPFSSHNLACYSYFAAIQQHERRYSMHETRWSLMFSKERPFLSRERPMTFHTVVGAHKRWQYWRLFAGKANGKVVKRVLLSLLWMIMARSLRRKLKITISRATRNQWRMRWLSTVPFQSSLCCFSCRCGLQVRVVKDSDGLIGITNQSQPVDSVVSDDISRGRDAPVAHAPSRECRSTLESFHFKD